MKNYQIKCVILGNSTVGKTSILNSYFSGRFDASTDSTLGAVFRQKLINLDDDERISLQFWDTAGQERYRALIPMYTRGANIALIVFDITNRDSFRSLDEWVQFASMYNNTEIIIISNKSDLDISNINNPIQKSEIDFLLEKYNCKYFSVSAKTNENIDLLIDYVLELGRKITQSYCTLKESKEYEKSMFKSNSSSSIISLNNSSYYEYIRSYNCCNI